MLIPQKIAKVLTPNPTQHLDVMYRDYRRNYNQRVFVKPLNRLYHLSDLQKNYEHRVLNAFGAGKEYDAVANNGEVLRRCITWIQDVLMAILAEDNLEEMHRKRGFDYQTYGDFVLFDGQRPVLA